MKECGCTKWSIATSAEAAIEMVVAHAAPFMPHPMRLMKMKSSTMLSTAPPIIIHMPFMG